MKTLELTQDRFAAVYQGLLYGEGWAGAEARLVARVQDKLEKQGLFDEDTKMFGILPGQLVTVELEDAEFGITKQAITHVKWRGLYIKKAVEAMDYLDSLDGR